MLQRALNVSQESREQHTAPASNALLHTLVSLFTSAGVFWFKGEGSEVLMLTLRSLRTCAVSPDSRDLYPVLSFWPGQILAEN